MMKDIFGFDCKSTQVFCLEAFIRWLVREGYDENILLENTDLDKAVLNNKNALISLRQYNQVVENSMNATMNIHIGIKFGLSLGFNSQGLNSYAMMISPTLGDAVRVFVTYAKTRSNIIDVRLQKCDKFTSVEFDSMIGGNLSQLFTYEFFLASFCKIFSFLNNQYKQKIRADLSTPKPNAWSLFEGLLGCDVMFNQPINRIMIPNNILHLNTKYQNYYSFIEVSELLDYELGRKNNKVNLISKLKSIISNTPFHRPMFNDLAEQLLVSPRTLRRELFKFGISYRLVLDETRKYIAIKYLCYKKYNVNRICQLMDFKNIYQLNNKFNEWLGMSAEKYLIFTKEYSKKLTF